MNEHNYLNSQVQLTPAGNLYNYNSSFSTDTPTRSQFPTLLNVQSHTIYLGYLKKYSQTIRLGSRWQSRHFFLQWSRLYNRFFLIYAIVSSNQEAEKWIREHNNHDVSNRIYHVMSGSTLINRLLMDAKGRLPITKNNPIFKLGKNDDTNPQNYITVYFEDIAERPYLELYSDDSSLIQNLDYILTHINSLLFPEQQDPILAQLCSASPS
tara:strand:- start:165 stop:794 length:630 start_codon:yes stop_codon:yes gene_type:complete